MLLGTIEFAVAVIGIAIGLFVYKDGHGDRIRPFEIATVSKEITEKEFKKWKKNKNVEITPHGILDTTPVLNNGKITTEYIRTEIDIDNPSFPISDFTVEQRAVFTCDPQYKYASDVNYYDTKDEMTDAFADYYIALLASGEISHLQSD